MWKHWCIYHVWLCIAVHYVCITFVCGHDFRSFDDGVLFNIVWPGKNSAELLEPPRNAEPYLITTANNEKYQCFIPDITKHEEDHTEVYTGPNPIQILAPLLYTQTECVFKLESYWTYELCHGYYIRQYHEDREGKKVKVQEYDLGTFSKSKIIQLSLEYEMREKNPNRKAEIPVKKIYGINMPYVEIEMTGGTICDLNNKPRKTRVLYVCFQYGKPEIFSLKETSSCEYEAIVFSPLLCSHPDYKPQDTDENEIKCLPVDNAPKKPQALLAMEIESLKLRHQKVMDDKLQKVFAVFHIDKEGQDGEARVRLEIHPVDILDKHNAEKSNEPLTDYGFTPAEVSPIKHFLSGKKCWHGGNGWWKYRFCYGRSVSQYHMEKDGTKVVVNLGKFDKEKHLEWIAAHPHKKPKPLEVRKQLSHFYSGGSICDKTGKLRQTEVKLKCVEDQMSIPPSVSLFLLEPKTCEYILGVESPLICDILEYADENGLLDEKINLNFDKLKTTVFHIEQDDFDERIANGDE